MLYACSHWTMESKRKAGQGGGHDSVCVPIDTRGRPRRSCIQFMAARAAPNATPITVGLHSTVRELATHPTVVDA